MKFYKTEEKEGNFNCINLFMEKKAKEKGIFANS